MIIDHFPSYEHEVFSFSFCSLDIVILFMYFAILCIACQMVDAWGGWGLFQGLLRTLKQVATKHGVSIAAVAVKYILDQVKLIRFLCRNLLFCSKLKISH